MMPSGKEEEAKKKGVPTKGDVLIPQPGQVVKE